MGVLGKFTVKQKRRGGKVALRSVPPRDAPEKVESKVVLGKGVLPEKEKFDLCAGLECKFIEAAPTSMCYEPMFTQGTQAVRLASIQHCKRWGDAGKVAQEYREGELLEDVKFIAEGMDLTIPAGTVVKIFPWEEMEDFYVIEYEGDAFSVEKSKIKIVTGPQPLEVFESSRVAQEGGKPAKVIEIADAIRRENPGIGDESAYRMAWKTYCTDINPGYEGCKGGYPQAPPATSEKRVSAVHLARGIISAWGGHPMSGLWTISFEDGSQAFLESGYGARNLVGVFGEENVVGQDIYYSVDEMGVMVAFTPASEWTRDPLAVGETTEVGVEAKKVFAQDLSVVGLGELLYREWRGSTHFVEEGFKSVVEVEKSIVGFLEEFYPGHLETAAEHDSLGHLVDQVIEEAVKDGFVLPGVPTIGKKVFAQEGGLPGIDEAYEGWLKSTYGPQTQEFPSLDEARIQAGQFLQDEYDLGPVTPTESGGMGVSAFDLSHEMVEKAVAQGLITATAKKVFAQDEIDHVIQGLEDEALDSLTRKVEEGDRFYDVGEGLHFVIGAITGDEFSATWATGVYSGLVFQGKVSVLLREVDEGNIERTARTIFAQEGDEGPILSEEIVDLKEGDKVVLLEDIVSQGQLFQGKGTELTIADTDSVQFGFPIVRAPDGEEFTVTLDQIRKVAQVPEGGLYQRWQGELVEEVVWPPDATTPGGAVTVPAGTILTVTNETENYYTVWHPGSGVVPGLTDLTFLVRKDKIRRTAQVPEDEIKPPTPPPDRTPGGFSKNMSWEEVQGHELHSDLYDSIEEAQNDLSRFEMTHGVTPAIVFCYDEEKYAIVASLSTKKSQEEVEDSERPALYLDNDGDSLKEAAGKMRAGDKVGAERIVNEVHSSLTFMLRWFGGLETEL